MAPSAHADLLRMPHPGDESTDGPGSHRDPPPAEPPQPSPAAERLVLPHTDVRPTADSADERRRDHRVPCSMPITGAIVQPLKSHPVATGTAFVMRMLDISRGGAQLQTPWPL